MNNLIYELWDSPSKTISGLFHQPLSLYTPPLLLNLLVIVCIPQRTCLVLFPIGGTSNSNSFHNSRLIPPWGIKQDLCPCCVASLCRFKKKYWVYNYWKKLWPLTFDFLLCGCQISTFGTTWSLDWVNMRYLNWICDLSLIWKAENTFGQLSTAIIWNDFYPS